MLAGAGLGLTSLYRASVIASLDRELAATVDTLLAAVSTDAEGQIVVAEGALPNDPRYGRALSGRYWSIAPIETLSDPATAYRSRSLWDGGLVWPEAGTAELDARRGELLHREISGPDAERLRIAALSVQLPERARPVVLLAGADLRDAEASAREFGLVVAGVMALLAVGLLIGIFVQIRLGLAPLRRIRGDIAGIRAGRKTALSSDYPREIAPLAGELNLLLDHNRQVVERARTHVGNLAHALKTPIAILMNEAQGGDDLAALVRRQTETMSQNVSHYLRRAQAAATAQVLGARCEVGPVFADLTRALSRLYRDKDLTIDTKAAEGLAFRGERQDLEEMVGNLLENACKWADGAVRAEAARTGAQVVLTIDDDGPGLPADQRETAIRRGARLDGHAARSAAAAEAGERAGDDAPSSAGPAARDLRRLCARRAARAGVRRRAA